MSKRRKKVGLPPGSIVFTGDPQVEKVHTHYIKYNQEGFEEKILDDQENFVLESSSVSIDWYDMRGMHNTALIEKLGAAFNIHSLVLENAVDIHQAPKFEEYENGNFIILQALSFDKAKNIVLKENIAIYFRTSFAFTIQETEDDLFKSVRQRIQAGKGRIRQRGADYLVYALIDMIIDNYYTVLDDVENVIEALEDKFIEDSKSVNRSEIHHLKKELLVLRKSIAPLREAINRFAKTESDLVEEKNMLFIRDIYNHTIQIMDLIESYRDVLNGLQDLFLTEVSFKMNQVMQVLTLVSTIFIPLMFLSGLYGMNFDDMPELHWKYGYFGLLGLMLFITIGLLFYFRKKKWI